MSGALLMQRGPDDVRTVNSRTGTARRHCDSTIYVQAQVHANILKTRLRYRPHILKHSDKHSQQHSVLPHRKAHDVAKRCREAASQMARYNCRAELTRGKGH